MMVILTHVIFEGKNPAKEKGTFKGVENLFDIGLGSAVQM
jgi:hypothetical protein